MLYDVCLGRAPDDEGLAFWTEQLRTTGDAPAVLSGILASAEAKARRGVPAAEGPSAIAEQALAALGRRPRVVDIGAQSLGADSHAYAALARLTPLDIVGFDPLSERLDERSAAETGAGELTLLPYAVGDGGTHTLYINNEDATSSLFPLNERHNADFNHLGTLHTVRTEEVETRRLDDILPPGPIDFFKLDIQGAELMVLEHAAAALDVAGVVHCEVEFGPIYQGQPLYPHVQLRLAEHGYYLVDFHGMARYHYLDGPGPAADRLLWADAVFFRESDDPEVLAAQALVAEVVYEKHSLAAHLLSRAGH